MKYDLNSKPNKSATRTLRAFSQALAELLEERSLESITIGMLCDACDYPRATFYNYFDDIYDLLYYSFGVIRVNLDMDKFTEVPEGSRTLFLFEIFYNYLEDQWDWLSRVLEHNPQSGECIECLRKFIRGQILGFMETAVKESTKAFPLGIDIMAEHYSRTIELVLTKCFMSDEKYSKEEALKALDFLLGSLERSL